MAKTDFIAELRWRGMLQDSTPSHSPQARSCHRPQASTQRTVMYSPPSHTSVCTGVALTRSTACISKAG